MNNLAGLVVFSLIFVSHGVVAVDKVIYGRDNRVDAEFSSNSLYYESKSVSALIKKSNLKSIRNGESFILNYNVENYGDSHNLCREEKFYDQPAASACTGFLVAPNVMVTAGHCYSTFMKDACDTHVWVFDYKINDPENPFEIEIPKKNVYKCKKILSKEYRSPGKRTKLDFAIIELDRPVRNRRPLTINRSNSLRKGSPLTVMGHPFGLPLKIADSSKVLSTKDDLYFAANLDTFQGNSGSPVFNSNTGKVEGILVRGRPDKWKKDLSDSCYIVNVCDNDGQNCGKDSFYLDGEEATKFSYILNEFDLALDEASRSL